MNGDNFGLVAVGVLAVVILFLGARTIDNNGDIRIGQGDPIDAPKIVRSGYSSELLIEPSRGGSFLTEVRVDGAPVDVLVDTGASFTTLRESDAQRAGVNPSAADYTHRFSTANGEVFAARAEVLELEMGPALLSDVTIFVLPDDRLEISLLGMNVLRQFDRMEMTQTGLSLTID